MEVDVVDGDGDEVEEGLGSVMSGSVGTQCHRAERTGTRLRPAMVSRPPQLGILGISEVIGDVAQSEGAGHECGL